LTIRGVIFDLDGTLVSLPIEYSELYAKFRQIMGVQAVEPLTKTVAALNDALRKKVFETWTRAEFEILPRVTIIKEGMKLYEQYSEAPKALVTMQGKDTTRRILHTLTLTFWTVITREDSLDRTAQIALALEKLRLKPENVLVIGDRETDKTAAEKNGCKFRRVKT
jgi:HAD superfamily hydrolase (TIGR01549 family)